MLTIIALCFAIGLVSAAHKVAWTHDDPHFHKLKGWHVDLDSSVPHHTVHRFAVFLTHEEAHLKELNTFFEQVSDPQHENYGKHATAEELGNMMLHKERHDRVVAWLRQHDVQQIQSRGDVLLVEARTDVVERLFQTTLRYFAPTHQLHKRRARAHGPLHVPQELADDVHVVAGLTELLGDHFQLDGARQFQAGRRPVDAALRGCPNCANVTPDVLRSYYNVSSTLTASNQKQAVSAFGETFSAGALSLFGQKIAKSSNPYRIAKTPGGPPNPMFDEGEGDLDVQYIVAMGGDGTAESWFWSVGESFWILEWCLDVGGTPNPPKVHSLSYGTSIQQQCAIATSWCNVLGYNSSAYVARTNIELQKLGAMGLTVLVSAGDNGAPGRANNGHCPLDPAHYCPLGGCAHTSSGCASVEMSVTKFGARLECVLPLGAGGFGCQALANMLQIAPQNYSQIFYFAQDILQNKLGISSAVWEADVEGQPHLYMSPRHTCASIDYTGVIDTGKFELKGYVFDPMETHVGETFVDEFPGSSPYVTSVGMTTITDVNQPEKVGSILTGGIVTGGGGFSIHEPQPAYQAAFVANYLATTPASMLPDPKMFNPLNRAFPDISLTGERYVVVGINPRNGSYVAEIVSGTSASSPALAGLLSMINEAREAQGQSSLGFLNPLLYQAAVANPSIFHDITGGNNACTHVYCCLFGFPARAGWDASTGLGSPDFGRLFTYATS